MVLQNKTGAVPGKAKPVLLRRTTRRLRQNPEYTHHIPEKHYTYADYKTWPDDERCELIGGRVYAMASPSGQHQRIQVILLRRIEEFLENKKCQVFGYPYDVRLFAYYEGMDEGGEKNEDEKLIDDESDEDVVQPDILIVCDPRKLYKDGCHGAPDFIAEIVSPSSSTHDKVRKLNLYFEAEVREYWIIDPVSKTLTVHTLTDDEFGGQYVEDRYGENDVVKVGILDGGLTIKLSELFAFDEVGRKL
jgi:Uma2 family endonuclease